MSEVWCDIPVFNNAATIGDIACRCRQQISNVVVVDDGSTDADLRELLKSIDVSVVRHPTNQGKGAALLTALRFAADRGAEYLITIDGDGQHFPEDIPRFLPALSPHTILVGSREEISGVMPKSSRFGREFSDFWICVECGADVRDTQSGFRAYPVNDTLQLPLASRHYNLEMEVISRATWAGLRTGNVPIRVWYPPREQSASSFHPFRDNLRISLLHTRLVLRRLLPIPHRRLPGAPGPQPMTFARLRTQNASPLGLTMISVIAILLNIVLWPWGWILVMYLAMRLHLNKIAAVAISAICLLPMIPAFCVRVGKSAAGSQANPHWIWLVGSHIVAFTAAPFLGLAVYLVARRIRDRREKSGGKSE